MAKWISIKDSLPEDGERVLTYRPATQDWASEIITESYIGGRWGGDAPYRGDVTYWMPLPEPPKEGKQ